ncbi:MAG: 3-oxoacyl-[acyl-carrier protein] reductase [Acidobacteriota bacterium]|nr:3-oxoacyl-[acyl-carrier protein] reductase [Acidobacteriota bacterium]
MLAGKIAFVSGGTGYIGTEICRALTRYGAQVIFSYHANEEKARELVEELKSARAVLLNFRDPRQITGTIETLYKEVNRIDILVNNAGVSQVMPFAMLEEEDVDLAIDINMKGTIFLTKAVVRGMIRNRTGVIISMGSIAGERVLAVPIMYAMTKASISGFTYALAPELKKFGIRVNSVVPGLLEGGVAQGVPEDLKAEFMKHCAAGRAGTAQEVAEVVAFLASDRASYINGQNIHVNGGI